MSDNDSLTISKIEDEIRKTKSELYMTSTNELAIYAQIINNIYKKNN